MIPIQVKISVYILASSHTACRFGYLQSKAYRSEERAPATREAMRMPTIRFDNITPILRFQCYLVIQNK